jgi:hypothetical protein
VFSRVSVLPEHLALFIVRSARAMDKCDMYQIDRAWFKNALLGVTHGISARTSIRPALGGSMQGLGWRAGASGPGEPRMTQEVLASEHVADPSATPQDSSRLDWGLHSGETGGGSGRTEARLSSPPSTTAIGRSSFAAGC